MTPVEILKAARAKIEKPENWTQGACARYADGSVADRASSPNAVCWCMLGAIWSQDSSACYSGAEDFLYLYTKGSVADFNDTHTHAEVLQAFDKAIAALEKAPVT